jgi:hypothetical protein
METNYEVVAAQPAVRPPSGCNGAKCVLLHLDIQVSQHQQQQQHVTMQLPTLPVHSGVTLSNLGWL